MLSLDPVVGHEQAGSRPCVIVSDPDVLSDMKFPLACVVPVTGTPGHGALYPSLAAGRSGLAKPSFALIDQIRSIDKRRIQRVYGQVSAAESLAIERGLRLFLGLGEEP